MYKCSCTISITFCTGRANQSDAANDMLHIVSVNWLTVIIIRVEHWIC